MVNIGNDWDEILKDEFSKEYYLKLRAFLKSEYKSHCIHPDMFQCSEMDIIRKYKGGNSWSRPVS